MFNSRYPKHLLGLHSISPAKVVILSFLLVIIVGTIILMLPISSKSGQVTMPLDALFTATTATCVTGLVVQDTYTYWSTFGQIVILLLIQIGGLGLVTITSFFSVVIGKRLGFRGMDLARESTSSDSFGDVRVVLKTIVVVTLIIEAIGALILSFTFVPRYGANGIFISIFLSVSSFCNAGLDPLGFEGEYASLTNYVGMPQVYIPIAILIIFGGLGFLVIRELVCYKGWKKLSLHSKLILKCTVALIFIGMLGFAVLEWDEKAFQGLSFWDKLGASFFQSVSARTAGYNTIDLEALTPLSKVMSIVLMFIGTAPQSTGGGIKISTVAVIFMTIISVLKSKENTEMGGFSISYRAVYRAIALFFLGIFVISVITVAIVFLERSLSTLDVLYEVTSAFCTTGLSTGVTAKSGILARALLIFTMFIGRVGAISLLATLSLETVKGRRVLPQGKIIIG